MQKQPKNTKKQCMRKRVTVNLKKKRVSTYLKKQKKLKNLKKKKTHTKSKN